MVKGSDPFRLSMMKTKINYFSGALLTLVTYSATAADAHSVRQEIELFFSSDVGNIVLIILMLLFLLWLLLPLAVFGLKRKLNNLIRENKNLTGENKTTNKILAEIRDELAVVNAKENATDYTEQAEKAFDEDIIKELIEENKILTRESKETNKILADIRDELAAISEEEDASDYTEQAKRPVYEGITLDTYNEIKFDP